MCLMFQETRFQVQVLKPCKFVQEPSQKVMFIKTQQLLQELGQTRIPITLFFTLVEFSLVQLVSPSMALKIILIYVYGCEKRKPKYTFMDWMKNSPEKLNFINLDK